jgi:hypothetical protein
VGEQVPDQDSQGNGPLTSKYKGACRIWGIVTRKWKIEDRFS